MQGNLRWVVVVLAGAVPAAPWAPAQETEKKPAHVKLLVPAVAQVTVDATDSSGAEESLYQVLAGARAALDPEQITLVRSGDRLTRGGYRLVVARLAAGSAAQTAPFTIVN